MLSRFGGRAHTPTAYLSPVEPARLIRQISREPESV